MSIFSHSIACFYILLIISFVIKKLFNLASLVDFYFCCLCFGYWTELGSACLTCSKANLLTLGCSEGKYNVYCRAKWEWAAHAQKTWTPWWLQGRVFKGNIRGEVCRVPEQLVDILLIHWWWGNRVVFQELTSSIFWFQPVWVLHACRQHAVNFFHLVGVLISTKHLMGITEEELNIFDFALWPKLLLFCLAWLLSFVSAFSHFSD